MEIVLIARCPEHNVYGDWSQCPACHGPVELVAMVPADYFSRDELEWLEGEARQASRDTMLPGAVEPLSELARKLAFLARGPSVPA